MKKADRIKQHKIFVLVSMLADELDDVKELSVGGKDIFEKSKELQALLDPVIDSIYENAKNVSKTTYIQELQNKFDTLMRKNYQVL